MKRGCAPVNCRWWWDCGCPGPASRTRWPSYRWFPPLSPLRAGREDLAEREGRLNGQCQQLSHRVGEDTGGNDGANLCCWSRIHRWVQPCEHQERRLAVRKVTTVVLSFRLWTTLKPEDATLNRHRRQRSDAKDFGNEGIPKGYWPFFFLRHFSHFCCVLDLPVFYYSRTYVYLGVQESVQCKCSKRLRTRGGRDRL